MYHKLLLPTITKWDMSISATAEKALSDNVLVANVSEQYSDRGEAGYVISRSESVGVKLAEGSTVTIHD